MRTRRKQRQGSKRLGPMRTCALAGRTHQASCLWPSDCAGSWDVRISGRDLLLSVYAARPKRSSGCRCIYPVARACQWVPCIYRGRVLCVVFVTERSVCGGRQARKTRGRGLQVCAMHRCYCATVRSCMFHGPFQNADDHALASWRVGPRVSRLLLPLANVNSLPASRVVPVKEQQDYSSGLTWQWRGGVCRFGFCDLFQPQCCIITAWQVECRLRLCMHACMHASDSDRARGSRGRASACASVAAPGVVSNGDRERALQQQQRRTSARCPHRIPVP